MGGLGGPHGKSLGLMKCLRVTELEGEKYSVTFISENGSAIFTLSKEEVLPLAEGQSYNFNLEPHDGLQPVPQRHA
jgi:hypothetical protein